MATATSDDHQQRLISSFIEIAVGQTIETALQFLKATSWNLEDAINLFLVHGQNQTLSYPQNSSEQYWSDNQEEEQIHPPLPSIRDTLYDSSSMHHQTTVQVGPEEIWDLKQEPSDSGSVVGSEGSRLSTLYRPPLKLLFQGSFEDAKATSSRQNLWLLVNLHEGQKISTFYRIESLPPVVLLIDPITGQKMRSWSGVIEAKSFLEDLVKYMDSGPHEHNASLTSNKRIKTEKVCYESDQTSTCQDMSTFWDNFFEESSNNIDHILFESVEDDTFLGFPVLTEEPKGDCDRSVVCSLCIRFPDGRRKQRNFLKTEPVQLLWSFCYSQMGESEKKAFKLVQAIPGASKTLDYGANATFDQSGLANSLISVTWTTTSDLHQQKLISTFMEIAVGQTKETAQLFLKTTNWNLEEAINLFLIDRKNKPLSYHNSYLKPSDSDSDSVVGSKESKLSSLYRPPLKLLFKGSFEDAKATSSKKNLWLLVNLQSTTEFASHMLNRDLWSNEAVSQTIESSFVLWQVYDHTNEGKKISTFYKIESAPPVVLLIDPITGQKMQMWSGVIEAQSFVEDLDLFMEASPNEYIASLTRITHVDIGSSSNKNDQVPASSWGEEFEKEETSSSSNNINKTVAPSCGEGFENVETWSSSNLYDHTVAPSWGPEFEEPAEVEEEEEEEEETCLQFPDLTEEPKGDCDRSIVCSLCVRFPDGRRKQRRFLKSEPVQLLWSFCYSLMETSEKKVFKLVQAIPGASKTLDYGANMTFDQSGLANSMISVTWE
ncbi:putative plant UBX domain-containing protein 14 [Eutrema salsugineum]|uniref:putative plant UBX domain-containing protein 14 n=1 Tax=Eutrema salsugineum TaxID=72664 RepID=UPI000CECEBB1|nr:putative plant UBX domain-containing protein 14 [Eutrema salsugineum]